MIIDILFVITNIVGALDNYKLENYKTAMAFMFFAGIGLALTSFIIIKIV